MNSCLTKSKRPLFAMMAAAMILSARAQDAGQSIIFSSPQKLEVAPSLTPKNPDQLNLPATLQAPPMFFQRSVAPAAPAPQSRQLSSAEQQRMQTQKDWAFATPEEIFGVADSQPPSDTLFNDNNDDKNQTPFERYLDRQTQGRIGNTNAPGNLPWNFSHDRGNSIPLDPSQTGFGNSAQGLSRFLNGTSGDHNTPDTVSVGTDPNYAASLLSSPRQPQPMQPTKSDLEQQAAMERFRQLLNPNYNAVAAAPDDKFFPAPKVAVDPNITQPDFTPNPAGASFTPVNNRIGRPTGLEPLPAAIPNHSQEAVAPAWAPKPAPWLSQTPQPFSVPQRKF